MSSRYARATIHPAAASSPVLLHVPHSSRHIPDSDRSDFLIPGAELERELDESVDTATDLIAAYGRNGASRTPSMVVNDVARLVVDPERFPDQTERMNIHGRGALYTRTCDGRPLRELTPAREEELLSTYFTPYAQLVSDLVDERLSTTGRAVIIDVHSYPSEHSSFEDPTLARPEVCFGVDDFHTPPALLAAARNAFSDFPRAIVNEPYAGCYVPTKHYRTNSTVTALMVEVRRDVYLDVNLRPIAERVAQLGAALTRLIDPAVVN